MTISSSQANPVPEERRSRPDLRQAFEQVIDRVAPFYLQGSALMKNPMEFWAARVIHEAQPQLSALDVQVLVKAAARYFRDNPSETPGADARPGGAR
jgi:hypothetical protein